MEFEVEHLPNDIRRELERYVKNSLRNTTGRKIAVRRTLAQDEIERGRKLAEEEMQRITVKRENLSRGPNYSNSRFEAISLESESSSESESEDENVKIEHIEDLAYIPPNQEDSERLPQRTAYLEY